MRGNDTKPPFTLPDKPIDGYRVAWFEVSNDNLGPAVSEYFAVYHKNTKWADYDPDRPGGVDIVDEWMCGRGDYVTGRMCGGWYEAFVKYDWRNCFATRAEACREAVRRLATRLVQLDAEHARLVARKREYEAQP